MKPFIQENRETQKAIIDIGGWMLDRLREVLSDTFMRFNVIESREAAEYHATACLVGFVGTILNAKGVSPKDAMAALKAAMETELEMMKGRK